jgi:AcrR family transcriptional regulator
MALSHSKKSANKTAVPKSPKPRVRGKGGVPAGRRQRRSAETRIRIFHCALALIAERGLPNVTVEDITEAADVGKGTFFNYFQTKDHVLGVMAEIQIGKVREAAYKASQGKQTIYIALRQLAHQLSEEPGRSPALARAMISSFLGSENVRGILKRTLHEGRKTVGDLISAGQANGQIKPHLKKEKVAMQFVQSVMGTVLLWSLHESPPLNTWIEDSFQHFWRSITVTDKE